MLGEFVDWNAMTYAISLPTSCVAFWRLKQNVALKLSLNKYFRPGWIEKCYRFCTPDCFYFSKKIEWLSLQILFTPWLILMGTGILAQALYTWNPNSRVVRSCVKGTHEKNTDRKKNAFLSVSISMLGANKCQSALFLATLYQHGVKWLPS